MNGSLTDTLMTRYRGLPRAARWGALFVFFCGLYFGLVEPLLTWTSRLSVRADGLEAAVAELDSLTRPDSQHGRNAIGALTYFGKPYLPGDPALRREAVYTAVNDVLTHHGVASPALTERQANMRDEDARAILGVSTSVGAAGGGTGGRVLRLTLDIEFEADPDVIAAVVADLEASPEIVGVQRVRIDRPGSGASRGSSNTGRGRALRAEIVAEAWVPAVAPRQAPAPAKPAPAAQPKEDAPADAPVGEPHDAEPDPSAAQEGGEQARTMEPAAWLLGLSLSARTTTFPEHAAA